MSTVTHPARWSPAILDAIASIITKVGLPVHDPFAGTGERLGALCDQLGLPFTGTEIEPEFIVDPRVKAGDSTKRITYPAGLFMVVTSPVYPNGMCDHFHARDASKRHTYRQALAETIGQDRELHRHNMGRYGNRHRAGPTKAREHWRIAEACVRHWPSYAFVNVKNVVTDSYTVNVVGRWRRLLTYHGYRILDEIEVPTSGQRFGANGHLRADCEVVLIAEH